MVEDISTSRSQNALASGDPHGLRLPPVARWLLVALAALAGTLLLYRQALDLPLFFDDMIHLRWLDWHSLPSLWTTAEGLGYYRPLTMSIWKVEELLLGGHNSQRLHLVNVVLHALNATLAGAVAWRAFRTEGRLSYALLTTLLFVTFPFSYQAVPSTSSLSKPLIATLVLSSVVLYWEARRRRSLALFVLSLLAAFLAPFAYESGVMVPLAILSVELWGRFRGEFQRFSWLSLLFPLLVWGIALPLIMTAMPETGASLRMPSLLSLWRNGTYFMEGLLFPVSYLSTYLEQILAVDRYVLLTGVILLGFAGLVIFYVLARQMGLFLYACSWFVVAVLPLWFALDFAYVITSPRLLYLGAVGAALLWAGVPVLLWTWLPARWWSRTLAVVSALAILAFNVAYVQHKMALAQAVAGPLWEAVDAATTHDNADRLLYLNVPAWVAPKQPIYRVGTEGLTFIPEYVGVQDFVYVNAGVEREIRAVMFDPVKRDWEAYIGYAGEGLDWDQLAQDVRQADAVYATTYASDGLRFVQAGALEEPGGPSAPSAAVARFGDEVWLSRVQTEVLDGQLVLTLSWYAQQVPDGDATLFVHLYDDAGQLVTQADGHPLLGVLPLRQWRAGDRVRDVRYLALPSDVPAGRYTVSVGWYDLATGERLLALDAQGQAVPQDAFPVFAFDNP